MAFLRPPTYYETRFHPKQELAWLAYKEGLDLVVNAGRRFGKSKLISEVFVEDVEQNGKDCMYLALTQTQAREIMWPTLVDSIGHRRDWKSNESRLEWKYKPSNAIISLKGLDLGKDRLRGAAKRLIALDEYAFAKDKTIVKDVLVPQTVDYNGQMIYTSTPKGKNHFWELCNTARSEKKRFYYLHGTMFDNPFVSEHGRAKLIQEYTGADDPLYRQEVLAEFVDYVGLIFALPQDSYIENKWDLADLSHSYHWRGVDHGFKDPTACVWVAYNERKGHLLVYNEYKEQKMLVHQHAEVIKKLEPYHFVDTILDIDPQLIAEYGAIGLEMSNAGKYDRESRLLRVVNMLKTGKLKIAPHCTKLLNEMQKMEWHDKEADDHLCDALMYCVTNLVIPQEFKEQKEEFFTTHKRLDEGHWEGQDFG